MNLTLLQEYLHPYDECRILGRPFSAGSCAGELIALTRRGEETVQIGRASCRERVLIQV